MKGKKIPEAYGVESAPKTCSPRVAVPPHSCPMKLYCFRDMWFALVYSLYPLLRTYSTFTGLFTRLDTKDTIRLFTQCIKSQDGPQRRRYSTVVTLKLHCIRGFIVKFIARNLWCMRNIYNWKRWCIHRLNLASILKKKDFFTSAFTYFALTANSNDSGLKVCLLFLKFYYFLITYEICNKRESIVGGSVVLHDVEYKKNLSFCLSILSSPTGVIFTPKETICGVSFWEKNEPNFWIILIFIFESFFFSTCYFYRNSLLFS